MILFLYVKVGKTFSFGNGRLDDSLALAELGFQVKQTWLSFLPYQSCIPSHSCCNFFHADWRLLGCGNCIRSVVPLYPNNAYINRKRYRDFFF